MILVSGSTGRIGVELVQGLVLRGLSARALVHEHNPKMWELWSEVETQKVDLSKVYAVAAAADGCDMAFLTSSPTEDQVAVQQSFIEGCKMAGVKHIVKLSMIGAALDSPVRFFRAHAQSENVLKASGLDYTILRSHVFTENLLAHANSVVEELAVYSNTRPDASLAYVDFRDVAAVAIGAFTGKVEPNTTIEVTGAKAVSNTELATAFGELAETDVVYRQISSEALRAAMLADIPRNEAGDEPTDADRARRAWEVDGLIEMYEFFENDPLGSAVTDAVERIGNKQPRSVNDFIREFHFMFKAESEPIYQESL